MSGWEEELKMEMPVISLSGQAYDLGYQHGREAKEAIEGNFHLYLDVWSGFSGVGREQILKDAQKFIPSIGKLDPELHEELRGVAEGSGMQFEEIVALNSRWELNYAYISKTLGGSAAEGCTSFALTPEATKDNHTYFGQNWDNKPGLACIILRINQENKPNIIMNTEAGVIGQKGFNSEGIGVCLNYIRCETDAFKPGVPFLIRVRGLLNSESFPDCLKILMDLEGTNSANLVVAHQEGEAIDVECTPDDEFFLHPKSGILTHSNHFLSPNLRVKDTGKGLLSDTVIRNDRAFRLLQSKRGDLQFDTMKEVLKDHFGRPDSICRHRDKRLKPSEQWETLTSIIIDLTEGKMFYTVGPPCSNRYESITMNEIG